MKNISLPRNECKRFYDSIVDNTTTYNYYVERLTDIAVSRFKWTGFPDSIDTRFLELTLFEKGQAVVFEDDVMGLISLNTAISGSWNVYNVPIKRRAYATNGYNKNLTIKNSVIVFNNYIRTPSVQHILNFSKKLANIDVTIQININTQKTPIALKANKKLQAVCKLPSNAHFLNADEIVCYPRSFGDSRYPYTYDGLTLWAYASGNAKIEESAFSVLWA